MSAVSAAGTEVADGVFEVAAPFWGYPLSLYFLRSGDRWAVVDTGINTTPAEFIEPFMRQHGGLEQLELALLTHAHMDHIGGNGALREMAPHIRFAIHEADLGWAESLDRHIAQLYAFGEPESWTLDADTEQLLRDACGEPVAIDEILADGDVIVFGDNRELEIIHVGGHSPGEILIRDRVTGTVFPGDALQAAGALNANLGKRDFPMYRTVRQYLGALDRVEGIRPQTLCTAHGGTFSGPAIAAAVDESRSWTNTLTADLAAIVRAAGSVNLKEAVSATSSARPEYTIGLQINVTTAEHLNELVRRGDCRVVREDGAKRWVWVG
jgi:glyoxylase-like metal-dependent hydrolase (beta-lactamase superfamily II)